jgi:DNA polymerase-3 subunit gamma/tau
MSYQVLARKWRPQRFDDVVGQQAVTRTLKNAITSGRLAQAFVFAGSRGCGKTTTARILAKALNCFQGPTAEPCGTCDACVEIAQGRDIDVLEIDAASHTGIDNIREVVIAGLSIAPVRNRYKVFIIDEVHQLSTASFNALLKSVEEPPAHVVFMMATTELHKIPDTILSRSQVFEFKSIPTKAIAEQLRRIADAEGLQVASPALALIARAAEGSMRDAQSAFDQVIAFAGNTITVEDVSTVLGLVGRDVLFGLVESVVDEDGPRAFALADRAVEAGHDLRLVCRELARVVRDIMIVSVDPARVADGELADGEIDQLTQLVTRFSREDLMRAFDLLAKTEVEIRTAPHPRHYFEMALLRWMHLRKLVPLANVMEQLAGGRADAGFSNGPQAAARPAPRPAAVPLGRSAVNPSAPSVRPTPTAERRATGPASAPGGRAETPHADDTRTAAPAASAPPRTQSAGTRDAGSRDGATREAAGAASTAGPADTGVAGGLKDALLAEIRAGKAFFYNTVVAQAQSIEVTSERVAFAFLPTQPALRDQFEQSRGWIEAAAERIAGRRMPVVAVLLAAADAPAAAPLPAENQKRDLKAQAMSSSVVQAVLDVFPGEIRDVEEL